MTTRANGSVGIKETLTSLLIAFMMAFIFRGFVVEGFIIPTGSMAPTLLGKHVRFTSPYNGYDWATGPWDRATAIGSVEPLPRQGGQPTGRAAGGETAPITPADPMTALDLPAERDRRLAAGDRVFVLKYLPGLHHPERWDVVVFKNPNTHENYIKRLVGLPGEQLALVDGDVFARPLNERLSHEDRSGPDAWRSNEWTIARKNERTQRTMFQPVFDTRYTPMTTGLGYAPPVAPDNAGAWTGTQDSSEWGYSGSAPTTLSWTGRRPITDYYPYNQASSLRDPRTGVPSIGPMTRPEDLSVRGMRPYPDSDLAMTVAVEPDAAPVGVTSRLRARGMVFEGVLDPEAHSAIVRMRPEDSEAWTELDTGSFRGLDPNRATVVEFWHVDQALWLFVDGRLVCGGPDKGAYRLSPAERLELATTATYDELVANEKEGDGVNTPGVFSRPELYRQPTPSWSFSGGPMTVCRLALSRDIYYQPASAGAVAARGAHHDNLVNLDHDQYFMCGDNSPNSEDSRYWTEHNMDPWVRTLIDPTPGVVNRDLIVGKAFVVYFPAPLDGGPILAPDFGRVRWIW